jgi:ornithine cyclodeaminase/alanine dehydrogenase-like protein (mu-crystallin family)
MTDALIEAIAGDGPEVGQETLVLTREDVARLLPIEACIEAVERAFERHARGGSIAPGVLGTHVEGGGFHVKTAGLTDGLAGHPVFAAKVNANFPANPDRRGLPTIQGVIALFDAADGRVLALLDSIELTSLRTAAATAVAARYLAPQGGTVAVCGCGEQSRYQLRAVACVRPVRRVRAFDLDAARAARFAAEMAAELGVEAEVVREPADAAARTDIWITCTTARRWFLGRAHVAPGALVAAVGADNPEKQELEPELLARSAVVADVLDQCAAIGDLHHAIAAGLMGREQVRAELADVVSGRKPGRLSPEEIIVFDSTGTALQDVAAAALVYQRARSTGAGLTVRLGGRHRG